MTPSDKKQPATIDGATLRALPTPPWVDLKTIDDVRLEMARVYRDMRASKIDTQVGTRLVYVLSQIGRIIETSQIEARVAAVERQLRSRT